MKNKVIWEAFQAMQELNACRLPGIVAIRLGMNLNTIRPLYDAIEKQQRALIEENKVGPEFAEDKELLSRRQTYDRAWEKLLEDNAAPWEAVAKIEIALVKDVKEFWGAAQLLAAGILV